MLGKRRTNPNGVFSIAARQRRSGVAEPKGTRHRKKVDRGREQAEGWFAGSETAGRGGRLAGRLSVVPVVMLSAAEMDKNVQNSTFLYFKPFFGAPIVLFLGWHSGCG